MVFSNAHAVTVHAIHDCGHGTMVAHIINYKCMDPPITTAQIATAGAHPAIAATMIPFAMFSPQAVSIAALDASPAFLENLLFFGGFIIKL